LADRLITVKQEKMDVTQDLFAAADQVEHARGEKRKAEDQLEEQKERDEQRVAEHRAAAETLAAEKAQLEQKVDEQTKTCCICLDAPPNLRFDPCGHVAICGGCDSKQTAECPLCRVKIKRQQLVYL
jgi:hypothetical protein